MLLYVLSSETLSTSHLPESPYVTAVDIIIVAGTYYASLPE